LFLILSLPLGPGEIGLAVCHRIYCRWPSFWTTLRLYIGTENLLNAWRIHSNAVFDFMTNAQLCDLGEKSDSAGGRDSKGESWVRVGVKLERNARRAPFAGNAIVR